MLGCWGASSSRWEWGCLRPAFLLCRNQPGPAPAAKQSWGRQGTSSLTWQLSSRSHFLLSAVSTRDLSVSPGFASHCASSSLILSLNPTCHSSLHHEHTRLISALLQVSTHCSFVLNCFFLWMPPQSVCPQGNMEPFLLCEPSANCCRRPTTPSYPGMTTASSKCALI